MKLAMKVLVASCAALAVAGCSNSGGSGTGGDGGSPGAGGSGGAGATGGAASTFEQETVDLPSAAEPAETPGSEGVTVTNPKLIEMFGGDDFDLNNARYTRYYLSDQTDAPPDAIVVLVPGFEGGASTFAALAEGLARRAKEASLVVETWAIDRRSNQLEDVVGLDLAEGELDPQIGLNFLFGAELGLALDGVLEDEVGRRAVFYNTTNDVAFMAQWTTLVHSQDIDAVVEHARTTAKNANVFLGGHSAGTGYTARYAATDFNLTGEGDPQPGYAKLRGLVMLEGGGGSIPNDPPTEEQLDRIEAAFDGGLFGAVSSGQAKCIDGETSCSVATAAADCAAFANTSCTEPTNAYSVVAGLLSPQLLAVSEVASLEADIQGDTGQSLLQTDQNGIEGNNAIQQVPELAALQLLLGTDPTTSAALIGLFLDDDGPAAATAAFVATSLGTTGPVEDGIRTWLNYGEEMPPEAVPDNGPPPTSLEEARVWGQEVEPTDLEGRMMPTFYRGLTNFSDWYYPSSGLGITSGLGLDSSALSLPPPVGRGRTDIENLTQARNVNIPVIAFGGSNGLLPVPGRMTRYAETLGPCTAPSCDGATPRVVDAMSPNTAFPTFGGSEGGYEVYMSEGYAHVDVVSAEDDETNNVIGPLLDFVTRNLQ
jgi:pimeloyl-ACP methyl ester carboxylesterase